MVSHKEVSHNVAWFSRIRCRYYVASCMVIKEISHSIEIIHDYQENDMDIALYVAVKNTTQT